MKKCANCEKMIDDKYQFCPACNLKLKESNKSDAVVDELQKINNNLYALRTIQEFLIGVGGKKLVWVKKSETDQGHFEVLNK